MGCDFFGMECLQKITPHSSEHGCFWRGSRHGSSSARWCAERFRRGPHREVGGFWSWLRARPSQRLGIVDLLVFWAVWRSLMLLRFNSCANTAPPSGQKKNMAPSFWSKEAIHKLTLTNTTTTTQHR